MKKFIYSFFKFTFIIMTALYSYRSSAEPYCIALRGNGELMPSHWGALSHTIETFGVPEAIAGGSSASVSTFLMDGIFQNPILKSETNSQTQSIYAAFMVKSIEGYIYARLNQPEWQTFVGFVKGLSQQDTLLGKLNVLLQHLSYKKLSEIKDVLQQIKSAQVFYGPAIQKLHQQMKDFSFLSFLSIFPSEDWADLKALAAQIRLSISLIGKFDAKNDANLLVRDGVINFPATSALYAKTAQFYALKNASETTMRRFKNYLLMCAPGSVGKTWGEIMTQQPFCQSALEILINSYLAEVPNTQDILDEPMGQGLDTIVTAGFVRGYSLRILRASKSHYEWTYQPDSGNVLLNEKDIYFGYAGNQHRLSKIQNTFADKTLEISNIDKSKRFLSLGHTTWRQALAFSANEPGLGAYTDYIHGKESMSSIGGWSDLHPTLILKASGCKNVVYVTRRGGDTIFGQGLAKRIFNFDSIPWEDLDPYEPNLSKNQKLNNNGRDDHDSLWAKMYNLAYDHSSYAYSLAQADAVVCTNWNAFAVTKMQQLISDSYHAPIYNPSHMKVSNLKKIEFISEKENIIDPEKGYYRYSGCVPLEKSKHGTL